MIIKAVGIAIIGLCACMMLRSTIPSLVPIIAFCTGVVILYICVDGVREPLKYCYYICNTNDYGDYFKVMLKGLGVAYLSGIGADLCRDCGEQQLAGRIEFAAKAEILIIAFPLVRGLVELSESILIL